MAIIYEKKGAIAYITINRPEVMNALDTETMQEVIRCRDDFNSDEQLHAAIITGAGDRAFSTGIGYVGVQSSGDPSQSGAAQFWKTRGQLYSRFFSATDISKPMIAAIRGHCLSGGLELALSCDIRVASEDALFGVPDAQMASMPGGGATQRLTRMLPLAVAMKMLLAGESINAKQALQWGLVTDVVAPTDLMTTAENVAQRLADKGPLAVAAVKDMLSKGWGIPSEHSQLIAKLLSGMLGDTEAKGEGPSRVREEKKTSM